jgi:hypothetical protein
MDLDDGKKEESSGAVCDGDKPAGPARVAAAEESVSRSGSATDSLNSGKDDAGVNAGAQVVYAGTSNNIDGSDAAGGRGGRGRGSAACAGGVSQADLVSEVELERQVQAARAREARLAAQLSDLQQQIRGFNVRT